MGSFRSPFLRPDKVSQVVSENRELPDTGTLEGTAISQIHRQATPNVGGDSWLSCSAVTDGKKSKMTEA